MAQFMIFAVLALVASARAGLIPTSGAYVAPYASTYNAHHIDHAVAYPVASAPLAVAPASHHHIASAPIAFAAAAPVSYAAHAHAPAAFAAPARVGFAAYAPAPWAFAGHPYAAPAPYYF